MPSLGVAELTGDVEGFDSIFHAAEALTPVPIHIREPQASKGYYNNHLEQCIDFNEGTSQAQPLKMLFLETVHTKIHALPAESENVVGKSEKDSSTR